MPVNLTDVLEGEDKQTVKDIILEEGYDTVTSVNVKISTREPIITKNTAFNKNFGNGSEDVIRGNAQTSFRNKLINGLLNINQREVTGTVVLTAGQYGHDRYKGGASGCTYTFSTVANVTTITITAGSLIQVVEGLNLQSGTHVLSWVGSSQCRIDAGSYGDSGLTASLIGGTNATIEVGIGTFTKHQLEEGSVVTPFEQRPIGYELSLCQRYGRPNPSLFGAVRADNTIVSFMNMDYSKFRVDPTPIILKTSNTFHNVSASSYDSTTTISEVLAERIEFRLAIAGITGQVGQLIPNTVFYDAEI